MLKKDIEALQSAIISQEEKLHELRNEKNSSLLKKDQELQNEKQKNQVLSAELEESKKKNDIFLNPIPETINEEIIYMQLSKEIEEFRQKVKAEGEKLKPIRDMIINEVRQGIQKGYSKLDV